MRESMAVAEDQIVIVDEWRGLYSESWKGVIVDDAFAHPAKFSRALIRKIYDHAIAEGWATKGSSVIDPFGGVALGGFDAMRHGLNWFGCELEQKFVELGGRNIAVWNERYSSMPNWGTAKLIQGDSRKLANVLREAECCVSSPPFANSHGEDKHYGILRHERGCGCNFCRKNVGNAGANQSYKDFHAEASEGQLGAMKEGDHSQTLAISSPPYSAGTVHDRNGLTAAGFSEPDRVGKNSQARTMANYGDSEGQLGKLPPGDHSIVISSPPYAGSDLGGGDGQRKMSGSYSVEVNKATKNGKGLHGNYGKTEGQLGAMPEGQLCVTSPPFLEGRTSDRKQSSVVEDKRVGGATEHRKTAYGDVDGQLAAMSEGEFQASISSPPYEGSLDHAPGNKNWDTSGNYCAQIQTSTNGYGSHADNVGLSRGETFWSASRLILEQLHQVLTPNAHAVFVVKSFVRDKRIVDFPAQWAQLCEAVGFRLLHDHHALLTEHYGTQGGFHEDKELSIARKSFFRRLAESKGSPRIDYENVLCFQKAS